MRADNDLSSAAPALMRQVFRPDLLFGAHELAHSDNCLADRIVIGAAIAIDEQELIGLHFFEEVGECERGGEVGVERVPNLLRLANLGPLVPLCQLEQNALGVRLAESV